MNRLVRAGLLLWLAAPCLGLTPPQMINFQGKLIDPVTINPKLGPVGLTFKLYNVPTGGAALYTETQSNVPLTNGVFSVVIGTQTGISRELFLGASVYLGVTVTGDAGGEMTPRTALAMSPFAFSANQLSDDTEVRLVAGVAYSTFTNGGNLTAAAGVSGSSASFTNGLTASSATFLASGGGQYSIASSSGILMSSGTLRVDGEGDIINRYGIVSGSATFTAGVTSSTGAFTGTGGSVYSVTTASGAQINGGTLDVNGAGGITNSYGIQTGSVTWVPNFQPAVSNAQQAAIYLDTTTHHLMVSQDNGSWQLLIDTRTETMWIPTVTHPQITSTVTFAGAGSNKVNCVRFYNPQNYLVERMSVEVVTTQNATADVGIYNDATKALVVHMNGFSTKTAGVVTVTGLSGSLRRQTMYRYCFCASGTTATGRSVSQTDVTNTLENVFVASPVEGTNSANCSTGVLPATLGTITSASIVPPLVVIGNAAGP